MFLDHLNTPRNPTVLSKAGQLGLCLSRIWGVPAWVPPSHLVCRALSKLQKVCTFSGEASKELSPPVSGREELCFGSAHPSSVVFAPGERQWNSNNVWAVQAGQGSPSLASAVPLCRELQQQPGCPAESSPVHAKSWPSWHTCLSPEGTSTAPRTAKVRIFQHTILFGLGKVKYVHCRQSRDYDELFPAGLLVIVAGINSFSRLQIFSSQALSLSPALLSLSGVLFTRFS